MSDPFAVLEKCELLRDMGREERFALGEFLSEHAFEEGDVLFRAGDEAAELMLIAEGSVRLEERNQVLGILPEGEVLGGACLVSIGKRECDAVAAENTRVLALSCEGYLRLRADFPTVALSLQEGVLRELASWLRSVLDPAASNA